MNGTPTVPPDDGVRQLSLARPDSPDLRHIAMVGDTYTILLGELEVTFRGETSVVGAGETANVPANAPHAFRNATEGPVRMLCLVSPAGIEEYFAEVGEPVASRTSPAPELDEAAQGAMMEKAQSLAARYHIELLPPPGA